MALAMALAPAQPAQAQTNAAAPAAANFLVVEMEGMVEVLKAGAAVSQRAQTNQLLRPGDRLSVGKQSRAVVRLSDLSTVRLGEYSLIQVPTEDQSGFNFLRGLLYFFHRDKPTTLPLRTPTGMAVIRGTEFNLRVEDNGGTILSLLDGEVELSNPLDRLSLVSGEQGIIEPGQAPRQVPVLNAMNVIQWALYYPAVLDAKELDLTADERRALADSLAAYGAGDLLQALEQYPAGRQPASDAERVYLAALLLAVGQVERSEGQLAALAGGTADNRIPRLAAALRQLIAAVTLQPWSRASSPEFATEWMAESYQRQSRVDLEGAREAARAAAQRSPAFGFAWARLAELEFGFGRVDEANRALETSLGLSGRNAQAVALGGFLLAAHGRVSQAIVRFERAMSMDGALGNAWLGRGLCRIRMGEAKAGMEDLQIAATLEPQRALLRSYLGKAFSNAGDNRRASQELELAKKLDANDPTGWLYAALVKQQENRINEAVRDLEHSRALNDNRGVFRSRLLLDQDQAVRGANLAEIYRDAGMTDVSAREAARGVNLDYANFSAHLFLANSYDALRDPRQINLRYETPWLSEYLVANLLAPVGAGTLSPQVTQQEYSRLFERDRLGWVSSTEYFSGGDWVQTAAQYGIFGSSSYSAEAAYRFENGHRPNNDFEQFTGSLRFKQQLAPSDSVYLQAIYNETETGDVNQYYDDGLAVPGLRIREQQEPIVLAGWHREWAPGSHSLLLAGRLDDTLKVSNPRQQTLLFDRSITGGIDDVIPTEMTQRYRSELEMVTAEAQHIWQRPGQAIVVGGRFQTGEFDTHSRQDNPVFPGPVPVTFDSDQDFTTDFERRTAYAYYQRRIIEPLWLTGGVSYDWLRYPENHRYAPILDDEKTTDRVSPKAGLMWTPADDTTVRGAYSRSLGGVGLDQSFQLEPSQVAGFNQAFRSIIPESVVGANAAAPFESWGVSIEQKLFAGTYLGVSGEILTSEFNRSLGVFEFLPGFVTGSTRERLDYRERSLMFTVNQLLGKTWSLSGRYRLSEAQLNERFTDIPPGLISIGGFQPQQDLEAVLHQVQLAALFNHPKGIFAQAEAWWFLQSNHGYSPDQPGDEFWQFNLWVGYRFARRRAEVRAGLLNLTDQNYRLNPLNLHAEWAHDRTLALSFRFSF